MLIVKVAIYTVVKGEMTFLFSYLLSWNWGKIIGEMNIPLHSLYTLLSGRLKEHTKVKKILAKDL